MIDIESRELSRLFLCAVGGGNGQRTDSEKPSLA